MAQELLAQLQAGTAKFSDVLAYIEARYQHTPTAFQMAHSITLQLKIKAVRKFSLLPSYKV